MYKRQVERARPRCELVHRALADASDRHVDHPREADLVVRVLHEAQVGEEVLDLPAVVEADAADNLVRDPVPEAGFFQRSGLRVDPIGHDAVAQDEFLVPDEAVHLFDNELRLLLLGVGLGDRHRGAGVVAGEQVLCDAVLVGRDELRAASRMAPVER